MTIFLKQLWSISNKWQDCKIFTKLVTYPFQKQSPEVFWKKKVLLKICEISQENTCAGVSF